MRAGLRDEYFFIVVTFTDFEVRSWFLLLQTIGSAAFQPSKNPMEPMKLAGLADGKQV
jgi:hypothetical protein